MKPQRILLVEDERDAREALARALERAGYECTAADSGERARSLVGGELRFDAAVLDVKLGDDDRAGLKLIRPLRATGTCSAIVVITAFADLDKVKQALNDGASYLIEKPFHAAELLAVLQRVWSEAQDTSHLVDRALQRASLTPKEVEIAKLVLKGLPSAEIASLVGISDKTVRQHLSQIYAKCGVATRPEFFHYVFPS
ncbi:MAG TPA: response regulator transcription factor [Polyangiales bacterium]